MAVLVAISVLLSVHSWTAFIRYSGDRTSLAGLSVLFLSVVANLAKLGTNPQNTLHGPENERSSVPFAGARSPRIASVVFEAIFSRHGRITRPNLLIDFVKNLHFLHMMVTPTFLSDVNTFRKCSMCCSDDLEKMTM